MQIIDMNKFQVGDQVFAPFNGTMWPGRIQNIDIMAEVKFYKVKHSQKVPIAQLIHHDDGEKAMEVLRIAEEANNKILTIAIKMSKLKKSEQSDKKGNLPMQPLVKQEQQNNNCKEEEEEDNSHSPLLGRFESCSTFLLSLDEKMLLQECRQNKSSFLTFFNTTTNVAERVPKVPKMVIALFLQNYLLELLDENQEKYKNDKMTLHRKIVNIVGSHMIDLSVMLKTRLQKLVVMVINQYKGKSGDKMMEKTVGMLIGMQKQIEQQMSNYLEDYTKIAITMKPIFKLFT